MIQKNCNEKIDETDKKVVHTQNNKNDSDSNMTCICFKFVDFLIIMDQDILSKLKL